MERHVQASSELWAAVRCGNFAAQALSAWDPALKGRPFAVVEQSPGSHKTRIVAVSPEARALDIPFGLSPPLLARRFPALGILARRRDWEARAAEEMEAFLRGFTPDVRLEADGRALVDLTGTPALRSMGLPRVAHELRRGLVLRVGLAEAAVGLAPTRLVARVLSRLAAPGGARLAPAGFDLAPLAAGLLPGLSPACRERLRRYGLKTIGQIRALDRAELAARFGVEGDTLHALARGLDVENRAAPPRPAPKAEALLPWDENDREAWLRQVHLAADRLCFRMKRERMLGRRFALELRYTDGRSARRTFDLGRATDAFMPVAEAARRTFLELNRRRAALKSLSLRAVRPGTDTGQTDLFAAGPEERQRRLGEAVLRIREKARFEILLTASDLPGPCRFPGSI